MAEVAKKLRLFLIWEQDSTYQDYIRPHGGKYNIPTIVSDQFIALFYHWKEFLPADKQAYLAGSWIKPNILENHGPLRALYKAHGKGDNGLDEGDFRSEGDTPSLAYLLGNSPGTPAKPESWGGRFVRPWDRPRYTLAHAETTPPTPANRVQTVAILDIIYHPTLPVAPPMAPGAGASSRPTQTILSGPIPGSRLITGFTGRPAGVAHRTPRSLRRLPHPCGFGRTA